MAREYLMWETLEHEPVTHSVDWYWSVGLIGIAVAVAATISENPLFGIIAVVATFVLLLQSARSPRKVTVRILPEGIAVSGQLFPFQNMRWFSIVHGLGVHPRLCFLMDSLLGTETWVLLDSVDPEDVREVLAKYVSEEHRTPHVSEILWRYLGFL